jgi:hypothetical protein
MREIKIEVLQTSIFVYNKDEKNQFEMSCDVSLENSWGMSTGNSMWIGEHSDLTGLVYHEATHCADWVIREWLNLGNMDWDSELRAYLVWWIGSQALGYILEGEQVDEILKDDGEI